MKVSSFLTVRRVVSILLTAGVCASAGEYAVLLNGFRIHAQSHVIAGDNVTLTTDSGVTVLPATSIQSFELEEYAPPPPAPVAAVESASPTAPQQITDPKELLKQAAGRAGLPVELVNSVARAESNFQTKAISNKGAIGLMQLMPGTAAALNANPYNPKENAEAGAQYLADLLIKYKDDPHQVTKAIAAYNAGPGAVDKYNGIPPYRETINYVNRVVQEYVKSLDSQQ
jgi:soluble lytic murein transglycosylase-like protein